MSRALDSAVRVAIVSIIRPLTIRRAALRPEAGAARSHVLLQRHSWLSRLLLSSATSFPGGACSPSTTRSVGRVILISPVATLFYLFLICQLAHLRRIHQNRPKMWHLGRKMTKVVDQDEVEVVFSLDQICPLVNTLSPVLIRLPTASGSRDIVGVLSNQIRL